MQNYIVLKFKVFGKTTVKEYKNSIRKWNRKSIELIKIITQQTLNLPVCNLVGILNLFSSVKPVERLHLFASHCKGKKMHFHSTLPSSNLVFPQQNKTRQTRLEERKRKSSASAHHEQSRTSRAKLWLWAWRSIFMPSDGSAMKYRLLDMDRFRAIQPLGIGLLRCVALRCVG